MELWNIVPYLRVRQTPTNQNTKEMSTTKTKEVKKRIKQAKAILINIAPSLDGKDRMGAALAVGCSVRTVERYLNGEVGELPTALKLISILKPIAESCSLPQAS